MAASPTTTGGGAGTTAAPVMTITVAALTTTFTPASTCSEHRLTQLPGAGSGALWLNEPQVLPGAPLVNKDCYPADFLRGYTSEAGASSSIAPMFSPLVCPDGWHTASAFANAYIACCASGFSLALPTATADTSRPAYGGNCYSTFEKGQEANVTVYDDAGSAASTTLWTAAEGTETAYAHIIDGYAEAIKTVDGGGGYPSTLYFVPSETTATESSAAASPLNAGTVAGIVVGVLAGLTALAAAFFLLYRRKRKQKMEAYRASRRRGGGREKSHHYSYDTSNSDGIGGKRGSSRSRSRSEKSRSYGSSSRNDSRQKSHHGRSKTGLSMISEGSTGTTHDLLPPPTEPLGGAPDAAMLSPASAVHQQQQQQHHQHQRGAPPTALRLNNSQWHPGHSVSDLGIVSPMTAPMRTPMTAMTRGTSTPTPQRSPNLGGSSSPEPTPVADHHHAGAMHRANATNSPEVAMWDAPEMAFHDAPEALHRTSQMTAHGNGSKGYAPGESPFSDEKVVVMEKPLPTTPFQKIMNRMSAGRWSARHSTAARSTKSGRGVSNPNNDNGHDAGGGRSGAQTPRLNSSGPYELDGFVLPELEGH